MKRHIHDHYGNQKCRFGRVNAITIIGSILGITIILCGILSAVLHAPKNIVDQQFQSMLTLSPDSDIYQDWIKPPVPIYMKFYLFNVTNPEEIISGEKPKLKECGPYTFRTNAPKTNVTFYSNHTVSYYNKYTLYFDAKASQGSLNDSLYTLNAPLATMTSMMMKQMGEYGNSPEAIAYMNQIIEESGGDELFPTRNPSEILFGYQDPIFVLLKYGDFVPRENFGFFLDFNNSNDGEFLIHTGSGSLHPTFEISKWKGNASMKYWTSDNANMINGTDGSFLGRNLRKEDTPYIFVPQMCRSMKLEYDGSAEVQQIHTLRFRGAKNVFANSTINPENAGFCVPTGNCYDSGVMNLSPCIDGAPGFVSMPHFYNAAKRYQDSILGLHPDKNRHESFYFAEPKTGAVLKSQRRLQINIHMQVSKVEDLELVKDAIFPVLWIEGCAEADEATAGEIKFALAIFKFSWIISYIIIFLGVLILLISVGCLLLKRQPLRKRSKKDTNDHEIDTKNCTNSLL